MKGQKGLWFDVIIGTVLIIVGLQMNDEYYSTLVFAMGVGVAAAGAVHLARNYYWQRPQRRAEYERKKEEAHINAIDERKVYLRAKSGQVAYQIMFFVLLGVSFIMALVQAETWVMLMMYGLWIFQWIAGLVAFKVLEKRL